MTMMATTEPAMSRLFSRIDSLPRPKDQRLEQLLQLWRTARGRHIAPATDTFVEGRSLSNELGGFVFSVSPGTRRNYKLRRGASAVAALLGAIAPNVLLSEAPNRRAAVRFRRLFDWVLEAGEPVLVEFMTRHPRPVICEILALPLLLQDGQTPDAVFGGFACRPIAAGARHDKIAHLRSRQPLFYAFENDRPFAQMLVAHLGASLSPLEEREFEDGEHKTRPLVDVAGCDVYVIASLEGDAGLSVNDRLCRTLFFIGALKTAGANRITAVTPYLCYMRKDRRTKPHDPLTAQYIAQLFEAVGTDELVTVEAHNPAALENAFRLPVVHLEAYDAFAAFFARELGSEQVVIVSPDLGAGKRAESLRCALEEQLGHSVGKAFMEKQRSDGAVTGELFAGDIDGKVAIVFDDMICSGTTMARAAEACRERGATRIYLAATHGLFTPNATETLSSCSLSGVCVTNTVHPRGHIPNLVTLDVSGVFARAIATRLPAAT